MTTDKLIKDVTDLKADLKLSREKIEDLENRIKGKGIGTTKEDLGLVKRLELAEADLKAANDRIKTLESGMATKTTVDKTGIPKTMEGKGKVVIENKYKDKVSVMVNGTSYLVEKDETKSVDVAEGDLKYELIDFAGAKPVNSTIKQGETVTLRIK